MRFIFFTAECAKEIHAELPESAVFFVEPLFSAVKY